MKNLQEVKSVEKTLSGNEIYIISYRKQCEEIGTIEYRRRNEMLYLREIYVYPHIRHLHYGRIMLEQFLSSLQEPITAKLVSEESIHLFYTMKKLYPTIMRNIQISCKKCVCHYCKNPINFLDQLEITDLYYYHKKGKCPVKIDESLSLGFYSEQKRFKGGESRGNGRRSHTRNANQRDRGYNISLKLEYRDSEISQEARWEKKERKLRRKEVSEKMNSHYKEKHPRFRKISAEEYSQLFLQQLGY